MKKTLFLPLGFVLLFFIFLACSSRHHIKPAFIVGVLTNINWFDSVTGTNFQLKNDTTLIYYTNNLILYRQPVEYTEYNRKALKEKRIQITDDPKTINLRTIIHRFFIHHKNEEFGLMYEPHSGNNKGIRFNVDSLLAENPIFKGGTSEYDENTLLVSTTKTAEGHILEKYIHKIKTNANQPDTSNLYFDKKWESEIPYTLSKSIDSIRQMKLVRVKLIFKKDLRDTIEIEPKGIDVRLFKPKLNKSEMQEIQQVLQNYEKARTNDLK